MRGTPEGRGSGDGNMLKRFIWSHMEEGLLERFDELPVDQQIWAWREDGAGLREEIIERREGYSARTRSLIRQLIRDEVE
jgi:hypothetical protein